MFNLDGNLIDLENLQVVKKLEVGSLKFLALHYKNKGDQNLPVKIQYKSSIEIDDAIMKIEEALKNQKKVTATII